MNRSDRPEMNGQNAKCISCVCVCLHVAEYVFVVWMNVSIHAKLNLHRKSSTNTEQTCTDLENNGDCIYATIYEIMKSFAWNDFAKPNEEIHIKITKYANESAQIAPQIQWNKTTVLFLDINSHKNHKNHDFSSMAHVSHRPMLAPLLMK